MRVVKTEEDFRIDIETTYTAAFRAERGETNRLIVTQAGPQRLRFEDRGARLTAGRRCTRRSSHVAVCSLRGFADYRDVSAGLGDGDDRWVGTGLVLAATVDGGGGDDRILGGPAGGNLAGDAGSDHIRGGATYDTIAGGAGNDRIRGGPSRDTIIDGGGRDIVRGGSGRDELQSHDRGETPGRDRFLGGSGTDQITYLYRRRGVRVSLAGGGGVPGERDRLGGIETLSGTPHADRLSGTAGRDRIDGGEGGADVILARGGDDRISNGRAADVHCGGGRDRASQTGLLRPDCELAADFDVAVPANPLAATSTTVTMRLACAIGRARRTRLRTPDKRIVAQGIVNEGDFDELCDTTLTLTRFGRSLDRPAQVRLDRLWSFFLR